MKKIPAGQFKAKCLALLDEVANTQQELIVTKYGKPVACISPYLESDQNEKNPLKGSIVFETDLVSPIEEDWTTEQ